jgi:UDP:flavonoid glycosyltransferase YjiC (YdhE family)
VQFINKKQKILYCAFGSYFHGKHQHKLIAGFCLTLISALYNLTGIRIILSINQTIIDSLRKVINKPENFYYYTRVNQIQVLNEVDLFITHGGLGSIKEGINYSVPMVVYPVDKQWDQVGNGAKVEFHKIGLKGDIINDEPLTVRKTILRVLNDISYKENIIKMKQTIDENYNIDLLKEKIYTSLNIFTDENK